MKTFSLKLYAHEIAPIIAGEKIGRKHFMAISACESTAQYLAKLLNGEADCSSCGTVQYSDTVILKNKLSEATINWIKARFPFVSTYNA